MPAASTQIDWAGSYMRSWRVMGIDAGTWRDRTEVTGVVSASVKADATGRLLTCGTIDVSGDSWLAPGVETWARIELLARQGGVVERHAVATFLLVPSPTSVRRGETSFTMEGRSPLQPAEDEVLLAGATAPAGADGAEWAASMLRCGPAPVTCLGSFAMSQHTVFAEGTTRLEAARKVLDDAGWCMQLGGDGSVTIGPLPKEPSLSLGPGMLGLEVTADEGTADVPNRYYVSDGGRVATATDDGFGPTSYATRGRWVDAWESSPALRDGETLNSYAERRLSELASSAGTRSYERAWVPGITTSDVVRASMSDARLDGVFRVVEQSLSLGSGATLTETVEVINGD